MIKLNNQTVLCPECGSTELRLEGFTKEGQQKYRCLNPECRRYFNESTADFDIIEMNVRLEKTNQRLRDINRVKDKSFRERGRLENAVEAYTKELIEVFKTHSNKGLTTSRIADENNYAMVVHLSDVHFNEMINLPHNRYDFEIASARLKKFAEEIKRQCLAFRITSVFLAMTGDLMNSDRRLDELLMACANRSQATFLSYEILKQFVLDINTEANVTIGYVSGNESRVGKDHHLSDWFATDNYDFTLFQMLKLGFKDCKGIAFVDITDPKEVVIDVAGKNFLLLHGEGLPSENSQKAVQQVVGRYAKRGVIVHFVIYGHYHSAYLSDWFARNASVAGSNDYNEKGLNLAGKASQNLFVVHRDSDSINKINIDLQYTFSTGYEINKELEAYNTKSASKLQHKEVIHQVVI